MAWAHVLIIIVLAIFFNRSLTSYNFQSADRSPGYCRWDFASASCFCPRSKDLCDSVKQCYWNKDPSLTGNPLAFLGAS